MTDERLEYERNGPEVEDRMAAFYDHVASVLGHPFRGRRRTDPQPDMTPIFGLNWLFGGTSNLPAEANVVTWHATPGTGDLLYPRVVQGCYSWFAAELAARLSGYQGA